MNLKYSIFKHWEKDYIGSTNVFFLISTICLSATCIVKSKTFLLTGSNSSCLNCVCTYNEDLSGIQDSQTRLSVYGLISSYCTQAGCRTAEAEDTDLISNCSSNTHSKIPACVVCDGTLTFSSKSAPGTFPFIL